MAVRKARAAIQESKKHSLFDSCVQMAENA
jgi:hypothetical protein